MTALMQAPWELLDEASRSITDETIQLVQRAQQAQIQRNINTTTGLVGYDLAMPAAVVVPAITPLVNSTPRVRGVGIDTHHWKAIQTFGWDQTGAAFPGVVDQNATSPDLVYTVLNKFNQFQTIGAANTITLQAQLRGRQLEGDLKARRFAELIYALKITEEQWLTHGSDYLWAPPTPLAPTANNTTGSIAANTYFLSVSATNALGETFATAAPATVTTSGGSSSISMTCFSVPNATGYNIYVGTSSGSQRKQLAANFTTPNGALPTQSILNMNGNFTITLGSITSGANQLPTTNGAITAQSSGTYGSTPLVFNGLMALIFGAGNAVYSNTPNSAPSSAFTAAGSNAGTVAISGALGTVTMTPQIVQPAATNGKLAYTDIQTLLLLMYNNARANPDCMWVSPQDNQTVTNLLYNATGSRYVINQTTDNQGNMMAGSRVTSFLNPTTGSPINIVVLPFLPQGTILFGSHVLPYPVPGFDGPTIQVVTNTDYMGLDFPPTKSNPVYGFQTITDETLKITFLGGFGAITGIMPGTN